MKDFDGLILFFVAVIAICLVFFGFINTIQKSFKKAPALESPLSDQARLELEHNMADLARDQERLMDQQHQKISDMSRQMEQTQRRNKDMQDNQRRQMEMQQQRLRDMQRR